MYFMYNKKNILGIQILSCIIVGCLLSGCGQLWSDFQGEFNRVLASQNGHNNGASVYVPPAPGYGQNGTTTIQSSPAIQINAPDRTSWGRGDPSIVNSEPTTIDIEVNVYKIATAPFWHTGVGIDGKEYFFHKTNRVEICDPKKMAYPVYYYRTMPRTVRGNIQMVMAILASVSNRYNGTRYDLFSHNCNNFTNDLMQSLGLGGLNQEYLHSSGLTKEVGKYPGDAVTQELIIKRLQPWEDPKEQMRFQGRDQQLKNAFIEDAERLKRAIRLPKIGNPVPIIKMPKIKKFW